MPSFDLLAYSKITPGGISHSVPAWVVVVVPFQDQVTYDRSTSKSFLGVSGVVEDDVLIYGPDEIFQISTDSNKGSHTTSLNAGFYHVGPGPLTNVHPGDWVMAWMLNSQDEADQLIAKIKQHDPCNDFNDGLKFIGRAGSIRKQFSVSPDGMRDTNYTLNANGFTELDSKILYFPQLERFNADIITAWFQKIAAVVNKLQNSQNFDVNLIIPELLKAFLGSGPSKVFKDTPNEAYLVPATVAELLGKSASSGVFTFVDLLECVFGVQSYSNSNSSTPYASLLPSVDPSTEPFYTTGQPMQGQFLPNPPAMNNSPIWTILENYLNPATNEMYTTLRVNQSGKVVPHFILRQYPFTTNVYAKTHSAAGNPGFSLGVVGVPKSSPFPFTRFLDLPRWVLDSTQVVAGNIGTNDMARFNFVHIMGVTPGVPPNTGLTFQTSPPVVDIEDVQRSGLRPYPLTTNCDVKTSVSGPKQWAHFAADYLMGQHLTFNGSLTVSPGIQAPICIGDNLEYEGVVYHIEGVTHSAGIAPSGMRSFQTTLQLSHGMSSETTVAKADKSLSPSEAQYPSLALDTTQVSINKV